MLLFFANRLNKRANRFLGGLALIIGLWNCWVLGIDFQFYEAYPWTNWIPLRYALALGPCIYFYTSFITDASFSFKRKDYLHFIPVGIELLCSIVQGYESAQTGTPNYNTSFFQLISPILQLTAIISVLVYSFYALKKINGYHRYILSNYSNIDKYYLKWLYRLIVIFAILWFMWVPYILVDYIVFNYGLGISEYYPLYILMSVITIWLSAEAFLRPEIIIVSPKIVKEEKDRTEEVSEDILAQAKWLKHQMETNLFYLNSELTLSSLAAELDIHPNLVSKIINDGLGKNFSDFVNDYRIEAVINKFRHPKNDQFTLLGIAFDCGFNSKTTFNRVFKKSTGKTPFAYKNSMKSA